MDREQIISTYDRQLQALQQRKKSQLLKIGLNLSLIASLLFSITKVPLLKNYEIEAFIGIIISIIILPLIIIRNIKKLLTIFQDYKKEVVEDVSKNLNTAYSYDVDSFPEEYVLETGIIPMKHGALRWYRTHLHSRGIVNRNQMTFDYNGHQCQIMSIEDGGYFLNNIIAKGLTRFLLNIIPENFHSRFFLERFGIYDFYQGIICEIKLNRNFSQNAIIHTGKIKETKQLTNHRYPSHLEWETIDVYGHQYHILCEHPEEIKNIITQKLVETIDRVNKALGKSILISFSENYIHFGFSGYNEAFDCPVYLNIKDNNNAFLIPKILNYSKILIEELIALNTPRSQSRL